MGVSRGNSGAIRSHSSSGKRHPSSCLTMPMMSSIRNTALDSHRLGFIPTGIGSKCYLASAFLPAENQRRTRSKGRSGRFKHASRRAGAIGPRSNMPPRRKGLCCLRNNVPETLASLLQHPGGTRRAGDKTQETGRSFDIRRVFEFCKHRHGAHPSADSIRSQPSQSLFGSISVRPAVTAKPLASRAWRA
jgi:hypothetical protein